MRVFLICFLMAFYLNVSYQDKSGSAKPLTDAQTAALKDYYKSCLQETHVNQNKVIEEINAHKNKQAFKDADVDKFYLCVYRKALAVNLQPYDFWSIRENFLT